MQPAYLCPVTVFRHSSFLSSARKCLNSSRFRLTTSPTLHHKPLALRHSLVKLPPRPGSTAEPQASARGRRPTRPATPSPKPRSLRSPPPSRQPLQSPSSSYASASPSIPPIGKWTVAGLRQALSNSEVKFSRKMSKAQFIINIYIFFIFTFLWKIPIHPSQKRYLKPARQETIMSLQHRLPDQVPAPREHKAVLPTIFNGK